MGLQLNKLAIALDAMQASSPHADATPMMSNLRCIASEDSKK